MDRCFKLQKLKRTNSYKNVIVEVADEHHDQFQLAIDAVNNNYCPVCCDPTCHVKSDSVDPNFECPNGQTESMQHIQNILYADESSSLINDIERIKGEIFDAASDDNDGYQSYDGESHYDHECYATESQEWTDWYEDYYDTKFNVHHDSEWNQYEDSYYYDSYQEE